MASSQLISSIEALDGGSEAVDDVVILQERPIWVMPVSVVVFLAVYLALQPLDVGAILRGAISGGALGVVLVAASKRWLLAGTPTRAILARAKVWTAGAASIDTEYPRGIEMTAGRAFINATYELDGRTFVVSRAHVARLGQLATLQPRPRT